MLDNTTLVLIGMGGAAAGAAELLLSKLLGPGLEAIGTGAAAPLVAWKERRVERARDVLSKASDMITGVGAEVHTVPGRILWPILERSSLEEDETLRRRWAALLASAATNPTEANASFGQILAELGVEEAKALDWLYQELHKRRDYWREGVHVSLAKYYTEAWPIGPNSQPRAVLEDVLVRVGIFARHQYFLSESTLAGAIETVMNGESLGDLPWVGSEPGAFKITALGVAFLKACAGPQPKS